MDLRWGHGDINQIGALAQELVALRPDIILTNGTPETIALQAGMPGVAPPAFP
jgi:hypothetical protein